MEDAIIRIEHLNKQFTVEKKSMEVLRDINLVQSVTKAAAHFGRCFPVNMVNI